MTVTFPSLASKAHAFFLSAPPTRRVRVVAACQLVEPEVVIIYLGPSSYQYTFSDGSTLTTKGQGRGHMISVTLPKLRSLFELETFKGIDPNERQIEPDSDMALLAQAMDKVHPTWPEDYATSQSEAALPEAQRRNAVASRLLMPLRASLRSEKLRAKLLSLITARSAPAVQPLSPGSIPVGWGDSKGEPND